MVIFVLGWGCDHNCIGHLFEQIPSEYDVLCIYDLRQVESVEDMSSYKHRYLFAWSFGVWAAEQIFADSATTFTRAIALCGSPYPVSEEYGIAPKIMEITIKGIERAGIEQFNRRTYGEYYNTIRERLVGRPLGELVDELRILYQRSQEPYTPKIAWDKCIVGSNDVIFQSEKLLNYWAIRAEILPLPHYPFESVNLILQELDIR